MSNKGTIKSLNKDIHKTQLGLSDPKLLAKFSMQVGTKPYSQLGTGERCKDKAVVNLCMTGNWACAVITE